MRLTHSSSGGGVADGYEAVGYYVAGPVQAGNGECESFVE
jgi:hypothetical protein